MTNSLLPMGDWSAPSEFPLNADDRLYWSEIYLDAMRNRITLTIKTPIVAHTSELTFSSSVLTLASSGMSMEYGATLLLAYSSFPLFLCWHSVLQPFTHGFPCADIHNLLSPDLLHQLIKGVFKDHLVERVNEYLHITHGEARAQEIIQDIDRRLVDFVWFRLIASL